MDGPLVKPPVAKPEAPPPPPPPNRPAMLLMTPAPKLTILPMTFAMVPSTDAMG